MKRFVFTCGDINGIGPEIVIKTLQRLYDKRVKEQFIFICPLNVFISNYHSSYSGFPFQVVNKAELQNSSEMFLIYALPEAKLSIGKPTKQSGKIAFTALKESYKLFTEGLSEAVITAPISKHAINLAGINFPGQTEMFADWCNERNYLMTFLSAQINAALLTIHLPLNKVSSKIKKTSIMSALNIIRKTASIDLAIKEPKIAVLGLNPHAGEEGLLGKEEINFIKPVLEKKEFASFTDGPYPPDAFFAKKKYRDYDFVLGIYHDQVLIPFKMMNFNKGVNYTAGLPIVRTSPDHGCAFDIAGNQLADESSIYSAYLYARKISRNRKKSKSN
ncbi:MAG: 4-hydroxythreonine-4-phosphate dehydrogenase PdxA [Ignavibacterium sp.]|nr:4-hydroxythreonine-4-phosphate dehydrogenase PdxA [Ignavibacterium sp.]